VAITFGTITSGNGTSPLVITKPTVSNGDVIVAEIASSGTAITPPSGWTQIYATALAMNPRQWVGLRVIDGTEGADFTWTAGAVAMSGCIQPCTGVDNTTPQDVTATTYEINDTLATTILLPTLTPTMAGTGLITCGAANSASVTFTKPANIGSDAFTEVYDSAASKSSTMDTMVYSGTSATGTVTITLSLSRARCGALVALRPAAGGGQPSEAVRPQVINFAAVDRAANW
jgi:hypothetical protein